MTEDLSSNLDSPKQNYRSKEFPGTSNENQKRLSGNIDVKNSGGTISFKNSTEGSKRISNSS